MRGRLPKTGTYTGTGAALDVNVGFKPIAVLAYNETDGDVVALQMQGAAAAKGLKIVDSGSGTTDISFVSSNGITLANNGFRVGTDSDMNENAKVYRYLAW